MGHVEYRTKANIIHIPTLRYSYSDILKIKWEDMTVRYGEIAYSASSVFIRIRCDILQYYQLANYSMFKVRLRFN